MIRTNPILTALLVSTCLFGVMVGVRTLAKVEARTSYEQKTGLHIDAATSAVLSSLNVNFQALRDIDVVLSHATIAKVSPTRAFHSYVTGTEVVKEFPALRGMGVFEYVETRDLDNLVKTRNSDPFRRQLGYPPLVLQKLSEGSYHAIITMFAPLSRGLPEIGVDLMTRDRADTLNQAIQNRSLTISAPFKLFTGEPAVSIFRPYYIKDAAKTPTGFVATALATDTLLDQLRQQLAPYEIEFSIADISIQQQSSDSEKEILVGSNIQATDRITTRDVEVGGRVWRLQFRPRMEPPALFEFDVIAILSAIASMLSGLLLFRSLGAASVLNAEVRKRTRQLDEERQDALDKAKHDSLTGLLNRRGLASEHKASITTHALHPPTLISFDLDNFKQINDTLGHASGDKLLRAFASALTDLSPPGTLAARFGGDEFCVLLFAPLEDARCFAETILQWSRTPLQIDDDLMRFGVSAGIAVAETHSFELADLIVNADIALYSAKEEGRDGIQTFTDDMRRCVTETKRLADDIRRGIDNDEFVPYFHTQHDASSHALVGVEALVRWNHPQNGILEPSAFLDTARKMGVLTSIDRRTLTHTVAAIARLEAAGIEIPKFSVNVSVDRILDIGLTDAIADLPKTKAQLCFEILESDFLDDPSDELLFTLDALREKNIGLEVDDFGSGRASVIALKHLSPDRLKIDKSLVTPMCNDPHYQQLVSLIIGMGKALGMAITAEGVETAEHSRVLAEFGVDTLQGFYFSRPCSEAEFKHRHVSDAA